MSELDKKREEAAKLWREIRDLEEKKRLEEQWPEWKAREGTYLKFKNSYSNRESDADRWWLHRRISNVTPDGYMDVLEFQIDKDGRLDVRQMKHTPWEMLCGDWIPSTEGEWREAAMMAQSIVGRLIT